MTLIFRLLAAMCLVAIPGFRAPAAQRPEHAERLVSVRARVATWVTQQGDTGRVFNEPLLIGQDATPIPPAGKARPKQ